MIQIKRWDDYTVIHSGDFKSTKECLEDGVSKGICFYNAELDGADLDGAQIPSAKLNGAMLNSATLKGANLSGAQLNGAELTRAWLVHADIRGARLNCVKIERARMHGAKLSPNSMVGAHDEAYWVFISPDVVQAGCQAHSPSAWRGFSEEEIDGMDGGAALAYYPRLLDLMDLTLGMGGRPEWLKGK